MTATMQTRLDTSPPRFARLREFWRPGTRLRILGWYIALLTAALAFGLFIQRAVLLSQLDAEVDVQLRQEVVELQQLSGGNNPATGQPFGGDVAAIFNTFLSRNVPVEGEALFTLIDGRPHASTILPPVQLLDDADVVAQWAAVTATTRGTLDTSEGEVRYVAMPVLANGLVAGVFVVTVFMEQKRDDVTQVLRTGALVYGSTFVVVSGLAWFAAGRILRPVRLLTRTAQSITETDLSARIPVTGDDEIAQLARTFNDMLERLESAFATQRRFIDDAGHELRTPITIVRGHLELTGDDPAEREETARLVTDELDRMARIVDDLLLLARAQNPGFLNLHPFAMDDLTREVVAKASTLAIRDWRVAGAARVVVVGDRQRITQAIMNLIRNAVEHSPEGSPIEVGSRVVGSAVVIWVRDQGEGIAPEDRERAFERFARGRKGTRTSDGAGLGLAIVQAIVEAHGGAVGFASAPGQGTVFSLRFPLEGPGGLEP